MPEEVTMMPVDEFTQSASEVEFFGVKLKVRSPHLAALLDGSTREDVELVGGRAVDASGGEADTPGRKQY